MEGAIEVLNKRPLGHHRSDGHKLGICLLNKQATMHLPVDAMLRIQIASIIASGALSAANSISFAASSATFGRVPRIRAGIPCRRSTPRSVRIASVERLDSND
jgi:hypothetical protein